MPVPKLASPPFSSPPQLRRVAPAADTAGPVDIGGGRGMYVECRGDGAPAVVIVAGAKASAADWTEAGARRAERLRRRRRRSPGSAPTTGRERRSARRRAAATRCRSRRRRPTRPPTSTRCVARRRRRHAGGAGGAFLRRRHRPPLCADLAGRRRRHGAGRRALRGAPGSRDPGGVGDPARPPVRRHDRDAEALSRDRAARCRPELRPAARRPAAQADAARRAQRRPSVGAAGARLHRRRHCCRPTFPRTSATSPTGPRRCRRPSSPPACRARGTSRTPTAATRSTRTSRSSSSTRSATSSTRCGPAAPRWRPDAADGGAPATLRRSHGRAGSSAALLLLLSVLPLRPAYGQEAPPGRRRCAGSG